MTVPSSLAAWLGLTGLWIAGPPPPNLASASAGATVSGPQNASGSAGRAMVANDGEVVDYGPHHGYAWAWLSEPLVVTVPQPTRINKIEGLLLDVDSRAYALRAEIPEGGDGWRVVGAADVAQGWTTFLFEPVTCGAFRLVFTGTTLETRSYHVVEVAAYDDPAPQGDSPLKTTWLTGRRDQRDAELRLLGVDEALEAVFEDPWTMERVRRLPEGQRRWMDPDGDGDPDLLIFRDRGAVVVVADDDDDARSEAPMPDGDSDCWIVDLDADGSPDRVLDNLDDDGDGDPDRAHHIYLHGGWFGRRVGLVTIWDTNDNNRMWWLDHYSYNQARCQWQCDFGGNEGFCIFTYDRGTDTWVSDWECPFYFYDPDGDGLAEEAVRLEGRGREMRALRYSMNADDDAPPGQAYDYDFAVVALGPVDLPEEWLVTEPLRRGETGAFLAYDRARDAVRKLPWRETCLVWVENDCNIDPHDRGKHERWEGVINSRYGEFPQVGGPACGTLNKRYELDADNSGGLKLYAARVDGRLHLFGAESGTYVADDDGDQNPDRIVECRDADGDGFFDTWAFDEDADGTPDLTVRSSAQEAVVADGGGSGLIPLEWPEVVRAYAPRLRQAVAGHERVARAFGRFLTRTREPGNLEVRRWRIEGALHRLFAESLRAAEQGPAARRRSRNVAGARQLWLEGRADEAAGMLRGSPDATGPGPDPRGGS